METLNMALDYLVQYPYLGILALILLFSFVLPLSKTLVIVGSGVLAAKGVGNIYIYFLIALLAMLFADSIYYALGRLLGIHVLQWPIFASRRQAFDKASKRFHQHAWFTVLISRFLPYLRIFIYIVAGMQHMAYWSFVLANAISTVVYIAASLALGYFLAENQQLLVERVNDVELYAAITVIVLLLIYLRFRRHAPIPD